MGDSKENRYLVEAKRCLETMRSIRRDLHQNPELGMQETRTAGLIAERLKKLGINVKTGVGGTGVVGLLQGGKSGKTVALRADMDALPMEDKKNVPYASKKRGIAHSCGHDAHTAIQLGVADILSKIKTELSGCVKFIFQPSEDTLPGGALPMIKDGVLKNPSVGAIFSLHLHSRFPESTAVVIPGKASTSSTSFTLSITGKGGHIGTPNDVVNPVLVAAAIITTTQSILPKRIAPNDPLIFDFTAIHGGTVGNIVPNDIELKGGIRVSSPELLEEMIKRFENLVGGVAKNADTAYTLELQRGYPTIINDLNLTKLWLEAAVKVIGEERVIQSNKMHTGGDDVAYFQQQVPGVRWYLGIHNEKKGFTEPQHSPYYDFNEDIMAIGAAIQAQATVDYLSEADESI